MNIYGKSFVLGLAPTRRDTNDFDIGFAHENKAKIEKKVMEIASDIGNVEIMNIDFLNDEGLMIFPEDVQKIAKEFKEKSIDAVFVPHCNFGSEEAVALLGRQLGVPLLLWGPRDEMPPATGPRQTDTQCGLFASGMILDRYNVAYSYINNCWTDSPVFEDGLKQFIKVANVVKAFRNLRIGQISLRPRTFLSVKVNENELLERFGIDVVTIDSTEITAEIKSVLDSSDAGLEQLRDDISKRYDTTEMPQESLKAIAAMEIGILNIAKKYGCTAIASECWRTYSVPFGIMPCAGFGDLIQKGLPIACEGDIHGAISSVLLSAASMDSRPHFFADLTMRHPQNDNAELLWHCGPFPTSLAKKGVKPCMSNCLGQFEIEGGDITLCRFGESHGEYKLLAGEGRGVEGPPTNGNYIWFEADCWDRWERKLVKGPYIHHISGIHGKLASVLEEACDYMPGIEFDRP